MDKFYLVYIDDNLDTFLSRYLDEEFHVDDYELDFTEIEFKPENGYESLLSNPKVQSANIIFIDSRLFENRTVTSGKFTGEEFKLVLKKFFPFIEVIVITQNDIDLEIDKIAKYDVGSGQEPFGYYSSKIPKVIYNAVKNIKQYQMLGGMFKNNNSWDEVLKDKIIATLNGKSTYDALSKKDIDNLILAFKEIQEQLDEWLQKYKILSGIK